MTPHCDVPWVLSWIDVLQGNRGEMLGGLEAHLQPFESK